MGDTWGVAPPPDIVSLDGSDNLAAGSKARGTSLEASLLDQGTSIASQRKLDDLVEQGE